ncbi:MAG: hypothetical protein AB7P97_21435 [Hyphomonadaceae bacterium]
MPNLNIFDFSELNKQRCLRWHPEGLESWSLSDWAVALAGEAGEVCDAVKKLNRVRDGLVGNREGVTEETLREAIGKELADTVIYADLLATRLGFDLGWLIQQKFNEVSERTGMPERISVPTH